MEKNIKSFDGTEIHYSIVDRKSVYLVYLHGAGGDLSAWKSVRKLLDSYSSIAIDLRGHGKSQRPSSKKSYSIDCFAKDIRSVLDCEKISDYILIGHCFGAITAAAYNSLFLDEAKAFVLVDVGFFNRSKFSLAFIMNMASVLPTRDIRKHADFEKYIGSGDYDLERIYSDITHTTFKSWVLTISELNKFDKDNFCRISKPTLLIHGEKDSIFPEENAKELCRMIKGSKLSVIAGENHIIVLNNPVAVAREIATFVSSIRHSQ